MGGIPREAPFHDRLKCLKGNLYTCLHTYLRDERLEPKTERKRVRRRTARAFIIGERFKLVYGFWKRFFPDRPALLRDIYSNIWESKVPEGREKNP